MSALRLPYFVQEENGSLLLDSDHFEGGGWIPSHAGGSKVVRRVVFGYILSSKSSSAAIGCASLDSVWRSGGVSIHTRRCEDASMLIESWDFLVDGSNLGLIPSLTGSIRVGLGILAGIILLQNSSASAFGRTSAVALRPLQRASESTFVLVHNVVSANWLVSFAIEKNGPHLFYSDHIACWSDDTVGS